MIVNEKCGITIPLKEFPWNWNQIASTNGNAMEMGIAQMVMGTLITNLFPFSHNFPTRNNILY